MERIKSVELKSSLEEFFALTTMTLATVGSDGEPHAAAVYFAVDEALHLYYFSETGSQHAQDTAHDPRAAVAIHADMANWQEIHGLQIRGLVRAVSSRPEWQAAWQLYREKFPFVVDLEEVITANQMYAFSPTWIRLVDNRQGFGNKREWEVGTTESGSDSPQMWRISRKDDD